MKQKKIILFSIAILICLTLVLGVFVIMGNRKIDNVFDEMYLSVKNPRDSETHFYNMKEIGRLTKLIDSDHYYMGVYNKAALNMGEDVDISVLTDSGIIYISATIEIENSCCLFYKYEYSFKTENLEIYPVTILTYGYLELGVEDYINDPAQVAEFLHEHGVSREFVEKYRDYFLYDKLLTDWVTGNGERSKFTISSYGEFSVEDNTFAELDAYYG